MTELLQIGATPPKPAQTYPRIVTAIHQIEVTESCNLRCVYCPSKTLDKRRGHKGLRHDISREHFERAIEHAVYYDRQGTEGELSFTGIGESFMHPEFFPMVEYARERLPHVFFNMSTNGILLTDEVAKRCAEVQLFLWVSLHRPEKAGHAIQNAKKYGILAGYNPSPATSAFDWAGQVDWFVSAPTEPCMYLRDGKVVVLADGRVTTCCLDASGGGTIGHVDDEVGTLKTQPWSLCGPCHMTVP
jgi:Radical SAM superfamily